MERAFRRIALTIGLSVIGLVLAACGNQAGFVNPATAQQASAPDPAVQPQALSTTLPAGGPIQVYFTEPRYPDVVSKRAKGFEDALIDAINQSQESLDVAVYMFDLDKVMEAILTAKGRGVTVRIVTDSDSMKDMPAFKILINSGIHVVDDRQEPTMHDKFMVVDRKAVWTGSNNWTETDTYWNNNNAVFIQSPELAADYTTEFEEMYLNYRFGENSPPVIPYPDVPVEGSKIEVCFGPEGKCMQKVIAAVMQARKHIRFMTFAFTHNDLRRAVETQIRNGIEVSGVFETRDADSEASEYLTLNRLSPEIILDGNPYYMHHKVFILDDDTVVTGSFNFSRNADTYNDENLIIIHDVKVAARYLEEYERVVEQAHNPPEN